MRPTIEHTARGRPRLRTRVGSIPAFILVAITLTACFATQDPVAGGLRAFGGPGFWKGLWDGIIAPLAFIVSLFTEKVRVYSIPNLGRWYDFGFMIGIGGFTHGAWRSSRRRLKRTDRRVGDFVPPQDGGL
jgi:hypothetical protein